MSAAGPARIRIDFVSDVVCPWCAIGLYSLEQAIARIGDAIAVDLHFQPFELNPGMAREGEAIDAHLAHKYGITPDQIAENQARLRERGAAVGVVFGPRTRIYNTFDAHRLLHAAALEGEGRDRALKHALLRAYFTDGADISSHGTLLALAGEAGLDVAEADALLQSDRHADAVRAQEAFYHRNGIRSVPAVILNERHLVSGGQPPEVFEQALRQVAGLA